ncbi:unnamed protein product, partial [Durusdinium trenchii]
MAVSLCATTSTTPPGADDAYTTSITTTAYPLPSNTYTTTTGMAHFTPSVPLPCHSTDGRTLPPASLYCASTAITIPHQLRATISWDPQQGVWQQQPFSAFPAVTSPDSKGHYQSQQLQHSPHQLLSPQPHRRIGHCAFEVQENMQTYEKCVDYIQTHFMLLREDYIEPLRSGIKLYMQGRHSPKDLHVYTGVKVVGVLSTWEGLVYRIELRQEEIRRVSWEKSKQLMYGSLLCFSDDDFSSLIWATVWRRDPALIASKAQLDIRLPFDPWDDRLSPGKMFCCIENVTIYFE